jgi:hypothetical protein
MSMEAALCQVLLKGASTNINHLDKCFAKRWLYTYINLLYQGLANRGSTCINILYQGVPNRGSACINILYQGVANRGYTYIKQNMSYDIDKHLFSSYYWYKRKMTA